MISRLRKASDERDDGFTLIELIVVVIILEVLAAIAIPVYQHVRVEADNATAKASLRNLADAETAYFAENGVFIGGDYDKVVPHLSPYGFRQSPGVFMLIEVPKHREIPAQREAASHGFCAAARQIDGDTTFIWDSGAGGLQSKRWEDLPRTRTPGNELKYVCQGNDQYIPCPGDEDCPVNPEALGPLALLSRDDNRA